MKSVNFNLIKLEADEGKVFDYAVEHSHIDPETKEKIVDHLYSTVIFLGVNDSADNYIEIVKPEEN